MLQGLAPSFPLRLEVGLSANFNSKLPLATAIVSMTCSYLLVHGLNLCWSGSHLLSSASCHGAL